MTTLADALTNATAAVNANAQEYFAREERVALREAGVVTASGIVANPDDPTELARAGSLGPRFVLVAGGSVNALAVKLAGDATWPALLEGMSFTLPTMGPNTGPVTVAVSGGFTLPPPAVAGSGLPAGTLRLLNSRGGLLKAGDLDGSSVRVRADGAGGLRLAAPAASEVTTSVANYILGRPPIQVVFVDPINGNEANDGSTPALARKDLDAVLDGMGTTATAIYLLNDATIQRRRNVYASLSFQGVQVANNAAGYTPTYRNITFLGTATNSPGVGVGTFSSGLFLLNSNLSFSYINAILPAAVAGQDYTSHITSNSGTNIILGNFGVIVQSTSAGAVFGSTSTPIDVYGSVGFGANAPGHLFEGVASGANPNAQYRYRTNITSA